MVELRGITWDHERGLAPMRASAAQYEREHLGVRITWDARSLQAFGDQPIGELASAYDLLVIDHPFVGTAARTGCLLPLDEHLPAVSLDALARQSVGRSHQSYRYAGHQWALAIDAAAQVSAYRPDLLAAVGRAVPRTWDAVLDLASQTGVPRVAMPLNPVNALCSFLSLCAIHGEPPGHTDSGPGVERLVGRDTGQRVLTLMNRLVEVLHPTSLSLDPPGLLDRLCMGDDIAYCPLVFGYATYAWPGFAPHVCRFTNIPTLVETTEPAGAILGGTGLAVAASCQAVEDACAYAQWVAGAECQRSIYVESGGQPAHRVAWTDRRINERTGGFFLSTLETLDHAYVRPRHHGFVGFQDRAGPVLHGYLAHGGDADRVLDTLDALYAEGLPTGKSKERR